MNEWEILKWNVKGFNMYKVMDRVTEIFLYYNLIKQ
jgi:hypothetical protein